MSAEPDYLPADVLAEEEPKYLRRQKPVEIRKRKFSRKAWPVYRRVLAGGVAVLAGGLVLYEAAHYFLYSPSVMIQSAEQIETVGNRFVPREAITEKFSADMNRTILRVPLAERRSALQALPWVEQADVQRVLPDRIRVEITERTPVAFLRTADDLSLIDVFGVILERPIEGNFRFPVVSGIGEAMPRETREQRMRLFADFMKEVEQSQPGSEDRVSEVDLSDGSDLRATLTGVGAAPGNVSPVLVHFGDSDFSNRYRLLTDNIDQWRANTGQVDSVDLRFAHQVVVNPESGKIAANATARAPARPIAAHKRR
jgi:cell division protein FtsQ